MKNVEGGKIFMRGRNFETIEEYEEFMKKHEQKTKKEKPLGIKGKIRNTIKSISKFTKKRKR